MLCIITAIISVATLVTVNKQEDQVKTTTIATPIATTTTSASPRDWVFAINTRQGESSVLIDGFGQKKARF